jgi:hypothetical protein
MNQRTVICFLLSLATVSASASSSRPAHISYNCGRTDGGAYEISFELDGKDISIHAEQSGLSEWTTPSKLEVLICDRRLNSCSKAEKGVLRLRPSGNSRYDGSVSYELKGGTRMSSFMRY